MTRTLLLCGVLFGLILSSCGLVGIHPKAVPHAPFYTWVNEALKEEHLKPSQFQTRGSKMTCPPDRSKVYASFCAEVFLHGIEDEGDIARLVARVREKAKGRLQHRARISFYRGIRNSEQPENLIRQYDFS